MPGWPAATLAVVAIACRSGTPADSFHDAAQDVYSGSIPRHTTTWLDLQGHASFPAADTTIEPERIRTAIGDLDCLRYTVRDGAADEVFWFATSLPGMPIEQETRTDGRVVTTVSLVDYTLTQPRS
ncbi:hypothetical protein [Kribbella sp. NPDC050459]|uniref:hypothetical protein n=1 Tax=Kribbella sp. NPDC050459 TaxID=3155785 RepID=UPI00340C9D29